MRWESVAVLLGALTWTLVEYVLHRFLGHDKRTWPNAFAKEHTRHHSEGNYFAATRAKIAVAFVVLLGLGPVAMAFAGERLGGWFAAAFVAMYVGYEVLHRRLHTHPPVSPWSRGVRKHHFHHHFCNPKSNHGVTTPLWDKVFGTFEPPGQVRVPRPLAMRWLIDPQTDDVRSEFAQDYASARKSAPR